MFVQVAGSSARYCSVVAQTKLACQIRYDAIAASLTELAEAEPLGDRLYEADDEDTVAFAAEEEDALTMPAPVPASPKIYHIVHVNKLASITADGFLYSDAIIAQRPAIGTVIGMNHIKQRRLQSLRLNSHPNLFVGQCVPFYFCPRSVMLNIISRGSSDLEYKDGQGPIVHLVADLHQTVSWAQQNNLRWAFTLSSAATHHFEDRNDLSRLNEIDWDAINAHYWSSVRDQKQAEFLVENKYPWHLVEEIAVLNQGTGQRAGQAIAGAAHRPVVHIRPQWYY
ncbi:protein of unknown function [Sphingomonas sp. YR710]|uniref:type II toxin-antitoxin system toxin DNA ADP-ribosyl transferase DarT n=1 Tax=Sphingomonas sp. YR710 TaxID=1882773 RepID=UPI000890047D|nr:DUF4433 domain-containing protein [Sphingomonas sp. YR710]SDC53885.1 protein of unknown function [Sphingomonas sp. YR710]